MINSYQFLNLNNLQICIEFKNKINFFFNLLPLNNSQITVIINILEKII